MEPTEETIIIFPFMAQGHIIPAFALALQLEQMGYKIALVNTPLNIRNLKSSLPPASTINFLELPFNSSDHCGLPPESENTEVLPYPLIVNLLHASLSLRPAFHDLLSGLVRGGAPPLCVIADVFLGWTVEVAHELGLFHAFFSGAGGFGLACYASMWVHLPHRKTDSAEFTLPDFQESGKFHITQLSASVLTADGTDPWSKFQHGNIPFWGNSDGFLFNTVEELDKTGLNYFRRKFGLSVWPVGPILTSAGNRVHTGQETEFSLERYVEWLDEKPAKSVIYVSFGTQNTISASQMMQLAKALEGCADIEEKIRLVMGEGDRGKEIRRRACEVKDMIKDAVRVKEGFKGSSVKAMEDFLSAALLVKEKTRVAGL
ncbi:hypothetical protein RJ639_047560 [Escallonia herrerae]|uniref:Uncharacterized protein n=1 Tax=Escallonia herrerae TaxID=1293975 RepID=A0AA88W3G7_9ASTE|nr:hypothetical protein RJ639_047560 [Escallonia herrerae]